MLLLLILLLLRSQVTLFVLLLLLLLSSLGVSMLPDELALRVGMLSWEVGLCALLLFTGTILELLAFDPCLLLLLRLSAAAAAAGTVLLTSVVRCLALLLGLVLTLGFDLLFDDSPKPICLTLTCLFKS